MKTKFDKGSFLLIPNKQIIRGRPAELQAIYFWLCEHTDNTMSCFPSRQTIAEEAGVDIKSVDKYVPQLVELGILLKENREKADTKEKLSNLYHILIVGGVAPKTGLPTPENGATPTPENGAVTQSIINSIHLTPSAISENRAAPQKEPAPLRVVRDPETMSVAEFRAEEAKRGSRYSTRKTEAPSADIIAVLDLFAPLNPAYLSLRVMMPQREAVDRLLKVMNYEAIKDLVAFIFKNRTDRYCPTITTPAALEKKMGDLAVYYQKQTNKAPAFI